MWKEIVIQVPVINILVAVALITASVIMGRLKFAVLFSYLAIFYWVFFVNRQVLESHSDSPAFFLASFIISGVAMVAVSIWMFMSDTD